MMTETRFKIVLIDNPYDIWDRSEAISLLTEVIGLKLVGYRKEYPYGALPIDTSDFVGTHHVVCEERFGHLTPLMAYKTLTSDRCKTFSLPFPGVSLAKAAGAAEHTMIASEITRNCEDHAKKISYDSSWTIRPDVRKDRALTLELRNLMRAMQCLYHRDYDIPEAIGAGVLRFKTEQFFQSVGYRLFEKKGVQLGPFVHPFLMNEQIVLMHLTSFTPETQALADKYARLWENRITLASPEPQVTRSSPKAA